MNSREAYQEELVELQRLSLQNNSLTVNNLKGEIPSTWPSRAPSGIPKEMGNLRNLNILSLTSSGLSGPIPAEIFEISSLQRFCRIVENSEYYLYHSHWRHTTCHGSLSNLEELYLGYNKLAGEIPKEMGNLGNLKF
ncbi:hypothetical protein AAG906_039937 [Vitis piasezkii]